MISPLAYVDPSAKIGKNVTIHPFAYIDKNVEIGDDNDHAQRQHYERRTHR